MNKIETIIHPNKLEDMKEALLKAGIVRMTVTDAQEFERQNGQAILCREVKSSAPFLDKIKIEMVVSDERADAAVAMIVQAARKGDIKDGEILVIPVGRIVRIRTEEQNQVAHLYEFDI